MMMLAILALAASPAAEPPTLDFAGLQATSYRDCIAGFSRLAPAGTSVAEIGLQYCAPVRMGLRAAIQRHLRELRSSGPGQARPGEARMERDVDENLARYEGRLRNWLAAGGAASLGDSMPPIDVPYQITPAFAAYTNCVHDRLDEIMATIVGTPEANARALRQATEACREVRAAQLARALELQTDNRLYGSRAIAEAVVRRAFDRFDSEFRLEPVTEPEGAREK